MEVIKNAIIESTTLDDGDRGLLTAWLHLDYGGTCQGFGGHALYVPKSYTHHGGKNYAGHWIYRCMQVAGVSSWDKLKGKTIRVKLTSDNLGGKIIAIGHIVKDDWFNPEIEFKELPE
jgi:hypothetical protein